MQFIDCYIGETGRIHDARVFSRSEIGQHLIDLTPENFHLLGDSAYPLLLNLMTPFRDNGSLTGQQIRYNNRLSMTRSTVERAFGLLKGRFRRLKFLDEKVILIVPTIVMACCVLHNILRRGQLFEDEDGSSSISDDVDEDHNNDDHTNLTAVQKRYSIMNSL